MLPSGLFSRVFPHANAWNSRPPPEATLRLFRRHFDEQRIVGERPATILDDANGLHVPSLVGTSIGDHFWSMGSWYIERWMQRIARIANWKPPSPLPFPTTGELRAVGGWTRYDAAGNVSSVAAPIEDTLFLDVEIAATVSQFPVVATALTECAWYVWLAPEFLAGNASTSLIPVGRDKLIIGHNVSFDRARLFEEYSLMDDAGNRFLCTMSLNSAVAGICSHQRSEFALQSKAIAAAADSTPIDFDADAAALDSLEDLDAVEDREISKWVAACCTNSLAAVYKHYTRKTLPKDLRETLVKGSLSDVHAVWREVVAYCQADVAACFEVFQPLWQRFLRHAPHPLTLAGVLEMGSMFLPTDTRWDAYIASSETLYAQKSNEISRILAALAAEIMEYGAANPDAMRTHPWLRNLDWTPVAARFTKARFKKDGSFAKGGEPRPIGDVFFHNKPQWYRDILTTSHECRLTLNTRITPYLLKMRWNGHVVRYVEAFGWCFVMPRDASNIESMSLDYEKVPIDDPDHVIFKLPNYVSKGANVGSLFCKGFSSAFKSGLMSADSPHLQALLALNTGMSFWKGYRDRVASQFAVSNAVATGLGYEGSAIIPTVAAMGTVTRRAVEKTWMTASNPKDQMIGSELKSKIVAPPGYAFVGADVDSQELWIVSVIGDSQFGFHGASALGWMTLQGTKANKSDMHSRTAAILGISRDDAKTFNYGRIYGAGAKFATELLLRFNRNLTVDEAKQRVQELYAATKGKRRADRTFYGGTESFMFNALERVAVSDAMRTPTLCAYVSDSLKASNVDDQFLTSRINWIVQSSGVDYLHLLLVSMAYLTKMYNIKCRLAITIHDEIRYIAPEAEKYRVALALQIANLWTRCLFSYMLGMNDLPMSVAFFSAIEVDKVLRKESHISCVTPSSPTPVEPGESLDIYKLLEKCASLGSVSPTFKSIPKLRLPVDTFTIKRPAAPSQIEFQLKCSDENGYGHAAADKLQAKSTLAANFEKIRHKGVGDAFPS